MYAPEQCLICNSCVGFKFRIRDSNAFWSKIFQEALFTLSIDISALYAFILISLTIHQKNLTMFKVPEIMDCFREIITHHIVVDGLIVIIELNSDLYRVHTY